MDLTRMCFGEIWQFLEYNLFKSIKNYKNYTIRKRCMEELEAVMFGKVSNF